MLPRRPANIQIRLRLGRALGRAIPLPPAVLAVIERARRNRLDIRDLDAVKGLQLGREGITVPQSGDIKRLDAERIARRDDPVPGGQHEGEHAVQPADPARLAGAEQMQDGLAVARRLESAFAEDRPQVLMIVDLAVRHQQIVRLVDRLLPVLRPDDRQPAMRHHGLCSRQARHLDGIRPPMRDLPDHPVGEGFISGIPETDETTHDVPPGRRVRALAVCRSYVRKA